MLDRLKNSWALVQASARVLREDKELLIFPLLSSMALLLVTVSFLLPTYMAGLFDNFTSNGEVPVAAYLIAFLYYLAQYFVIFFANTALVGATMIRLDGGDPTVRDGFRIALSHSRNIFGYALISATVGMVLRSLSRRGGPVGRIVVGLVGLSWNLATYLVVPVLVVEGCGPIEAVKRSGQLLKKSWGEQIMGNFAVGLIFTLLSFAVIALGILLIAITGSMDAYFLMGSAAVVMVGTLALLALLNSALSGIYAAALYRYAAQGKSSPHFDGRLLEHAFRRST